MATYVLVDTLNTFFRARHVVRGDIDTKVGMALHITLNSVKKAWQDFNADHVVFCLEGRSWRKDYYEPYKRNRKEHRDAMTAQQQEEDTLFWEIFDEFKDFVSTKTNCTVVQNPVLEADDLIAGWVQAHPNDNHVIISTDGDFAQLIAPNVKQYNGIAKMTITHEGYFDDKGIAVVDKKTQEIKPAPEPDFMLFEKCMRGDTSDNVFSAYPGVRKKGTKNKTGLLEAFADKDKGGFNWNNIMLQRWTDHNEVEHRVRDDYERNRTLIDLTAQPKLFRDNTDIVVKKGVNDKKEVAQVGVHFMRFCGKYELNRISDQADSYAKWLNTPYQGRYIHA